MENYLIASEGILGIKTNLKNFNWSFGSNIPYGNQQDFDICKIRINLNVLPHIEKKNFTGLINGKYHYFSGISKQDFLNYERTFLFKKNLLFEVKNLLTNEPTFTFNNIYNRFIHFRFMNLHSIGFMLTDVAAYLLLRNNFLPIHCSSYQLGEATVVVFAPANTGKTLSTMTMCINNNAKFLAEDMAISDGEFIYSVPWTSTFRYYSSVDNSFFNRLFIKLEDKIPIVGLLSTSRNKKVSDFIGQQNIIDKAKVTHLVILEKGEENVKIEKPEIFYRKILNLNRYEYNYIKAPLLRAYEYFNPDLNIDSAYKYEQELLKKLVKNSQKQVIIKSNNPLNYSSMLLNNI